ncbi:hypothetical protein CAC42_186 [Sphaceloma murrayae]|uniref:ER-bound oxygenase mpaB/mpaB'/Rubber oxygenase catalytic domain-containing protein n=1 Tax=Sphaceloma murrayae TaxID=2082308 RepID=A0A2K1QN76_9PEZI|nr:hypothetical protein CAC42_186 [Sphaceloma murrayae]
MISPSLYDRSTLATMFLLLYLVLVRILRYRRASSLPSKYSIRSRADFATLTEDQAQDVLKDLVELEFPKFMGFSIVFALFKTYGIPSVSSLLVKTGELSKPETASKRTADTGVLLLEFCLNKPSSPRAMEATARMNYLHSRYLKAGKIRNDDMLYTLSLFALEPVRWINRFEWRTFTDYELCATGTFWKAMGDKMEIDMSVLRGAEEGWRDGMEWLDAIRDWSEGYEIERMVPYPTNRELVLANLDMIFLNVPKDLRVWGGYIVSIIAGPRLRKAMLLDAPPTWFENLLLGGLLARKYALRYLALPRIVRKAYIAEKAEENGRFSSKEYLSHPWYVRPTLKRRWGPKAWFTWAIGRKLPGDDGNRYNPEGYRIKDVGPRIAKDMGTEYMDKDLQRMKLLQSVGCPFKR